MSRYDWSTTKYLYRSGVPSLFPISMFVWWYPVATTSQCLIAGLSNSGTASGNSTNNLCLMTTSGSNVTYRASDTAFTNLVNEPFTTNAWHSLLSVSPANNDHEMFYDGVSAGTSTATRNPSVDSTCVGALRQTSPSGATNSARTAFYTIWEAELTAREAVMLHRGCPPWHIRPESLFACYPLGLDSPDPSLWKNGGSLTMVGTVLKGEHNPPVALPFPWMRSSIILPIGGAQTIDAGFASETDQAQGVTTDFGASFKGQAMLIGL